MQKNSLEIFKRSMKLMGNQFEISIVSDDESWALLRIEDAVNEIKRIENILTTYNDKSQTFQINENAGINPVKVDQEVFELIERSLLISNLTQGAFDITYGSIDKSLWNFDTKMTALPDKQTALKSVQLIDYKKVILDKKNKTVFLKQKGMRIGFGGIGKGYAAEMAKKILISKGVNSGIVNASGDLCAWGKQPNGEDWTVGIALPNQRNKYLGSIAISNLACATSGNYEKFVIIDGKRYSHTIDPMTGLPASGIKSVSIFCQSAELADALTTPVMVMGIKVGLNLINQIPGIGCIIIDDNDKLHFSERIKI